MGGWRYSSSFIPGRTAPYTHWVGGCVGPSAYQDVVLNRNTSLPCPYEELNFCRRDPGVISILTELFRFINTVRQRRGLVDEMTSGGAPQDKVHSITIGATYWYDYSFSEHITQLKKVTICFHKIPDDISE